MRSHRIEETLRGAKVDEQRIEKAAELAKDEVNPITDVRASAAYRREMACVLTKRVLKRVAMGA
jgi:CO/xanthine dehydrogenase FAD-binding subunit